MGNLESQIKYYDVQKRRLIYVRQKADSHFWDEHWQIDPVKIQVKLKKIKDDFVSDVTKKYLKPTDGKILEGGCGSGNSVASLWHNGYQVIGIDFAKNTVDVLRQVVPELDIRLGDVRKLDFPDDYFVGYWSLGVIEHFWEGFDHIAGEMSRVVKKDGYLFLTFPTMSWLRRAKAKLGFYKKWKDELNHDDFYQFALNVDDVISQFDKYKFTVVEKNKFSGLKGLKDEVSILKPILQKLFDYRGNNFFLRAIRKMILIMTNQFANHNTLLVFKKY